jgi:integrase/recombinase XerD
MARMNEVADRFLAHLESRGYSPRTLELYRWSLGRFQRFLDEKGIESLGEVTPALLSEYQTRTVMEEGRDGRVLTAGTRLHLLTHVRQLFRYLVRHGQLLVNVTETIALPRTVKSPPKHVLNPREMRRLLLAPDVTDVLGLRDRAILEVLYATGIRVSELTQLDLPDIDLEALELHVRQGKGGRSRSVPAGGPACLWVGRYLKESRSRLEAKPTERALFLSCRGLRMDRANLARIVRTLGQKAKISFKVTPHGLRHAFATHLIQRQASLRHVQEMLGHQKIASTQIYTHLDLTDLKATHDRCHPRGRRDPS